MLLLTHLWAASGGDGLVVVVVSPHALKPRLLFCDEQNKEGQRGQYMQLLLKRSRLIVEEGEIRSCSCCST